MEPTPLVAGRMAPLDRADVDTDQIMPKQHLKRIDRTGFGEFVFQDWREDPSFVLNDARYTGVTVLLAGPNFGAGSSREHAVWGLQQYGFRAVVAASFGDIFRNNATKAGLLTVTLPLPTMRSLLNVAVADPRAVLEIDVAAQAVRVGDLRAAFEIDPHSKEAFLTGRDHIDQTLHLSDKIAAYETTRPAYLPRIQKELP